MSGRILTPEQIDALAALGIAGPWRPHYRGLPGVVLAGGDGSEPGASPVATVSGDSAEQQAARVALVAAAPDLLATVRHLRAGSYTRAVMSEILGRRAEEGERNEDAARRVVRERDEARAEVERLRAALEGRAPTLAEANRAHLHATLQARARRP